MKTVKLVDLAKTIRSKNSCVDLITFDIIFREKERYDFVRKSGVITKASMAKLFSISEERIVDFVEFDPALAIKFTIKRLRPSGSFGEGDVFASQQYAPLYDIEFPVA